MNSIKLEQFDIFPWNKNFETGIDKIDEQHRKLVDILNTLAVHLANRSSPVLLSSVFDELIDYTDYHFKSEEKIWEDHLAGDPSYQTHKRTHDSFIAEIHKLKEQQNEKPVDDVINNIVLFLSQWLGFHILDNDRRMAILVDRLSSGASIDDARAYANEAMSGAVKTMIDTVLTMYSSLSSRTLELMREKALRKKAEAALIESEKKLEFILNDNGDSFWEWDIINNEVTSFEETSPVFDIIAQNEPVDEGLTAVHPDDRKRIKRLLREHLDGISEIYSSQYRILRTNNTWAWFCSKGKVVERDENGTARVMVGTHSDITDKEIGQIIYNQSHQSIIVTDSSANIIHVNPAFTTTTGFTGSEVSGKKPFHLLAENQRKVTPYRIYQKTASSGEWQGELTVLNKDGQPFTALVSISTVSRLNEDSCYYVILFSDISLTKEMENLLLTAKEEAERNSSLKTEFINNMSHEIRTPMNGIYGFSNLLGEPDLSPEKQTRFINIIQSSSRQLLRIIDDILEVTRLGLRNSSLEPVEVCLNRFFNEQYSIFNQKKNRSQLIYLPPDLTDSESTVLIDQSKLARITENLIENALKFTPHGTVEFSYTYNEQTLCFYVKDNGIGISIENQKHVFDRFVRIKNDLSIKAGGLGLGLAIARENALLMNGQIVLQSKPGEGTTVFTAIPCKPVYPEVQNEVQNRTQNLKQLTVLVCDDDEISRLYLASLINLLSDSLAVIEAKNGHEAVQRCHEHPEIALVLMDIVMPEMSGYEATRLIKESRPDLPVVAQTAHVTVEEKAKILSAGCDFILSKPVSRNSVLKILNQYLAQP